MSVTHCRECQRLIPVDSLTCPRCGVIAPVLLDARKIENETPVRPLGNDARDDRVVALPERGNVYRSNRRARRRGVGIRRGGRRRRPHPIVYLICGLVLLILIVGFLATYIGPHAQYYIASLVQWISSFGQYSKPSEQRREEKTAGGARADPELAESESWAKAACQAVAAARLNASLTASFAHDDVARVEGSKAYVTGSLEIPNGFWAKLRHRYSCELTPRGEGRWSVTKVVFDSR